MTRDLDESLMIRIIPRELQNHVILIDFLCSLSTGEMIIGPKKALFMDEISTGLDSSTTFQIVTCLQQLTHITEATLLISLLQPAPETFDLFDDVILMAEGKIVYYGPCSSVQEFFEHCGFRCPPRKGVADFLQEVCILL